MTTQAQSQSALTYNEALAAIHEGKSVRRAAWGECKIIRLSTDADNDQFVHDVSLTGVIMEDCQTKECDCHVSIWAQPIMDKEGVDWVIA